MCESRAAKGNANSVAPQPSHCAMVTMKKARSSIGAPQDLLASLSPAITGQDVNPPPREISPSPNGVLLPSDLSQPPPLRHWMSPTPCTATAAVKTFAFVAKTLVWRSKPIQTLESNQLDIYRSILELQVLLAEQTTKIHRSRRLSVLFLKSNTSLETRVSFVNP